MIDTHIHLYAEEYDADRKELIDKAFHVGVQEFWLPAINSQSHKGMKSLLSEYPNNIRLMMGLHPCYVKPESYEKELKIVENELFNQPETYDLVGEIGIDLYWDTSTFEIQKEAFKRQIEWAIELEKPVAIHSRNSMDEILKELQPHKNSKLKGIFHCFSGTLEQAERCLELGFLLGIGGVVTFKNGKIADFLAQIPLDYIVLETDGPYLAPVPHRGKRNESSYLTLIVDKLSEIYAKSPQEIQEITTRNALKLIQKI